MSHGGGIEKDPLAFRMLEGCFYGVLVLIAVSIMFVEWVSSLFQARRS